MSSEKKDKKSKRDKSEHKSKKRDRDVDAPEEERKHKRSKSEAPADDVHDTPGATIAEDKPAKDGKARRSEKRKKKRQEETAATGASTSDANGAADEAALEIASEEESTNKASQPETAIESLPTEEKKRKKEKRRKDKESASAATDAMDVDETPSTKKLPGEPYPFFTQQVSQYLPLFPLGMIEPVEGYAEQHLKPLLNHYVPTFEGVLLGYHDVQVGEAPGRGSLTEKSENTDEAVLESIDEYAVGFGWLTAKLDLFKPSRGAWMEGSVNMQTEGHLGVVCWGMFNASIEAARLPSGWRWVSLLGSKDKTSEEAKLPTPEPAEDGQDVSQLHTTGYWVDGQGQRVQGTTRFQIKNFEVGVSGDYGYLSIEGTMLEPEAEKVKAAEEVEKLRRWKLRNGASRREHKRLPDFSMTKFGMDEEQEDEAQRAEVWKGSRPASETAE